MNRPSLGGFGVGVVPLAQMHPSPLAPTNIPTNHGCLQTPKGQQQLAAAGHVPCLQKPKNGPPHWMNLAGHFWAFSSTSPAVLGCFWPLGVCHAPMICWNIGGGQRAWVHPSKGQLPQGHDLRKNAAKFGRSTVGLGL